MGRDVKEISPDGRWLVTSQPLYDKAPFRSLVEVWDTRTGQPKRAWKLPFKVVDVCLTPDGKQVITGTSGFDTPNPPEVRIWNIASGRQVRSISPQAPKGVQAVWLAVSHDGTTLTVEVTDNGEIRNRLQLWPLK